MLKAVLSTSLVSGGKLPLSSDTVAPSLAAFCVVQYIGILRILPKNGNAAIINLSPLHSIIRTTERQSGKGEGKNVLAAIIFCAVDILLSPKPNPSSANGTFYYAYIQPSSKPLPKNKSNNRLTDTLGYS
jgi:hypothetical protein